MGCNPTVGEGPTRRSSLQGCWLAFWRARLCPGRGCGQRRPARRPALHSFVVPHERVQFALVRPSCLVRGQSRPNRIPKDVFPFLGVAFAASELAVPAVALPDFAILRMRPAGCGQRLPVRSPFLDRWVWRSPRSAENVNVIGHDDITSDHPTVGLAPCGFQEIVDSRARQDGLTILCAYGHQKDD